MAEPDFGTGAVHILPEMVCEPVHDLVVWTATSKTDRTDSHRVLINGASALRLMDQLLDAAGVPPHAIDLGNDLQLRPYYVSRSPSDSLGRSAMVAFAFNFAVATPAQTAATALVNWASQNVVDEMIVDGVEVCLSKGADIAVAVCERALMDN